ncbi:MAG: hypothetical protein INQ03_01120 [Candidatus Heimdallarchaeota archaeon]|nr:hypothetical protein [Candidatus Heimdallarchaeota archaeon]
MNIKEILDPIVLRAVDEGILSKDEIEKCEKAVIDEYNIENLLVSMDELEIYDVLEKLFNHTSEVLIHKTRKQMIDTLENGELIWELLFSGFFPLRRKNKFVFKINITLDEDTNIEEMLSVFDNVFCIRSSVREIKTGLCLGTKHFVVDTNEISLLAFAKKKNNTSAWVERGSHKDIIYSDKNRFKQELRRTAQDLLAKYYTTM